MKKIFFLVLAFFLLLESLFFIYIKYYEYTQEQELLERSNEDFKVHINIADEYLVSMSGIFYNTAIDHHETAKILYEAQKTSDEKKRVYLRKELYTRYYGLYKYMKVQDIRQFHFHLANGVSFLRFHKPELYGDSLAGIRPSIEYVEKTKKAVHCFEEGRIFNGYRNVYPLWYGKVFAGTVEISYPYDALQHKLYKADKSSASVLLMKTEIVDKKVFPAAKKNYIASEFRGLSYDKTTLKSNKVLSVEEIRFINKIIASDAIEELKTGRPFSLEFADDGFKNGKSLTVDFLPVYNLKQEHIAYIVHYENSPYFDILEEKIAVYYIFMTIIALLLSLIVFILLYAQKKRVEFLYEVATHDALTKIYNRNGIKNILKQKIGEIRRYNRKLSVIFFDIDHFKRVNDIYGHETGDMVLREIARLISKNIRQSDIFGRWGGEEFILFLPETSKENSIALAEKLRKVIQEHDFEKVGKITCSFGVTELQENESEIQLFQRVDELLYKAKEMGRNRVVSD